MRKKYHDDLHVNSKAHLSGILYTTRRSTITEKEFTPKKGGGNKPGFFSEVFRWLGGIGSIFKIRIHPSAAKPPRPHVKAAAHAKQESFWAKLFEKDSLPFYWGVGLSGLAAVVCAVFLTSGALEPPVAEVMVNDAGRMVSASTREATVGDFLEKNGIVIHDGDVLEVSKTAPIQDGMQIIIRRAMPLTIISGEEQTRVNMLAGTVKEALLRANIQLDPEDEVYPVLDSYVTAGMSINVIDVEVKTVTEKETLYYKETTKNDSELAKGKTRVATKGVNGVQENTIRIVYKNGVEVSRTIVEEKVVKAPVDEVVLIGTYVEPKKDTGGKPASPSKPGSTSKPGSSDTGKNNSKDDEGKLTTVPSVSQIHSGTLYEHKNVPPPASSIIKKTLVIDKVTAYTHTGNRTATGTWPKIGTIAADPKQISYGTKLYIPGYGYGRVEDTGSNRHAAGTYCLDLFMETRSECLKWGRKTNLKVYILK